MVIDSEVTQIIVSVRKLSHLIANAASLKIIPVLDRQQQICRNTYEDAPMTFTNGRVMNALRRSHLCSMMAPLMQMEVCILAMR